MKKIIVILFMIVPFISVGQYFDVSHSNNSLSDYVVEFVIKKSSSNSTTYGSYDDFGYSIKVFDPDDQEWGTSAAYMHPNDGPFTSTIYFYHGGNYQVVVDYFVNNLWVESDVVNVIVVPSYTGVASGGTSSCCGMEMISSSSNPRLVGSFVLDEQTGQVVFEKNGDNCGERVEFDCFSFGNSIDQQKVISANVLTFESNWHYDVRRYPKPVLTDIPPNSIETGMKNIWRVKEAYTYKMELDEDIISTSSITDDYKNYDRGTFNYKQFVWRDIEANDFEAWIKTSDIREYSANGSPTYEINALGVSSGAIFGYNNTQVIGVVQNARYFEVSFESFENKYIYATPYVTPNGTTDVYDNGIKDNPTAYEDQTTVAHTGNYSILLKGTGYFDISPSLSGGVWSNTDVLHGDGFLVQAWVQTMGNPGFTIQMTDIDGNSATNPLTVAQKCGDWTLYEAELDGSQLNAFVASRIKVQMKCDDVTTNNVYVDDIKIQPIKSEMVTYVYDDQFRIVASFDSQHFPLIYQYNQEGKLVRKLKETSQGIITISETQYNSKGTIRL